MDPATYFITWTTYGSWLPGDRRGWRKGGEGDQLPAPQLEAWSRRRLQGEVVRLTNSQQRRVESICKKHAEHRGWVLHAVSVRTNHVHLVVSADAPPARVRDQFKAYATRVLREGPDDLLAERVWARGGDVQVIDGDLEAVVTYVTEAQDRMDRGKS